jgi:hypothetical protein
MTLKHKAFILISFIISFLSIGEYSGYCQGNNLTSVNDVDALRLVAYKQNNSTLYVSFLYKNYRTDQLVFWRGTSLAEVSCNVYELTVDGFKKQKGSGIGAIKNHGLRDFNQGVYIDVVNTQATWGLVECSWTFGGRSIDGQTEFLQHKQY